MGTAVDLSAINQVFTACEIYRGLFLAFRPDQLVRFADYLPHWGVSVLAVTTSGEATLFVPALEPRDRLPEGIPVVTFGWATASCPDPWGELRAMLKELAGSTGRKKLSFTYLRDAAHAAPAGNAAEIPPLPQSFLDELSEFCGWTFFPADNAIRGLYSIKSERAIAGIRLANQVACQALRVFHQTLDTGVSEAEIAAEVERSITRSMASCPGVTYARGWAQVQSGPNTIDAGRFNRTTGRKLEPGDMVQIELATCVNGYWSDLTRMGCVGEPRKNELAVFDAVRTAQQMAVAAVAPGVSVGHVDAIARDHLNAAGYGRHFTHGLGHHVGYRYHDPGPALAQEGSDQLKEGMIVTIEPGAYGPDLGMGCRVEDNLLVTSDGYEVLSDYPRDLRGLED